MRAVISTMRPVVKYIYILHFNSFTKETFYN